MIYRLRPQYVFPGSMRQNSKVGGNQQPPPLLGMAGIAVGLPPPAVHEVRLENEAFVARLGFDFRIAHCEAK
jgi:neuronal PAS domain-containing protein 1/3